MSTRRVFKNRILAWVCVLVMVFCLGTNIRSSFAKDSVQIPEGKYYAFDADTNYTFSDPAAAASSSELPFGTLSVSGSFSFEADQFKVKEGKLTFSYTFDQARLSSQFTDWHIVEDSGKKVDTLTLDDKIKSGAVILQTSLDAEHWENGLILTDVFKEGTALSEPFYTTQEVQQQNGCYFRIIVVYKMERAVGSHKVAFVEVTDTEEKRVAEVYEFRTVDDSNGPVISVTDVPRKELGVKIKTERNSGFTGEQVIDRDDPHYGWDLGVFTINGYTRETADDKGTPVFLKNLGDRVVLWFTLKQDINCLNNNSALSIEDNSGSYDQHFEIARTDFRQGTLIIQFTDYQGVKHEPILYTNFLAANTKMGADTRVQLFEEGDYEVSLDYSIRNDPRKIGPVSVIPTYTDYKITFKFSIRNGNCMVFPFDAKTGTELADKAITQSGFRLDMARSRYLTIDVERQIIKENSDGTITTDTRFTRPAKDNDTYFDEGIYIFTVKNLYTNSTPTVKTIYVGSDKYLKALSKTGLTVTDLNEMILKGYTVEDDGSLKDPS